MIIYLVGAAVTFIILCLVAGWEKAKDDSISEDGMIYTIMIGTILWPLAIAAVVGQGLFEIGKKLRNNGKSNE